MKEEGNENESEDVEAGQDDDADGGRIDRYAETLLTTIDEVDTDEEQDAMQEQASDEAVTMKPKTGEPKERPRRNSQYRRCPVPGCSVRRYRLTRINIHLRDDHGVPLEKGNAGNLEALRVRQDAQFHAWCVAQGLPGGIERDQSV